MADVALSPVSLAISGGTIPVPFVALTPATLVMVGKDIATTASVNTGLDQSYLRLDRLQRTQSITDGNQVNIYFQNLWQKNCEATEEAYTALRNQVDAIQAALDAAAAAQATANQATVAVAQVESQQALSTSTLDPLNVLSADSSGTVTIAAHSRVYTDKTVSVNAGSVTGLTVGVFYRIYYNDAGREGGAVSYIATQDDVVQAGIVHVIGGISIPATGVSEGKTITPPGYVIEP